MPSPDRAKNWQNWEELMDLYDGSRMASLAAFEVWQKDNKCGGCGLLYPDSIHSQLCEDKIQQAGMRQTVAAPWYKPRYASSNIDPKEGDTMKTVYTYVVVTVDDKHEVNEIIEEGTIVATSTENARLKVVAEAENFDVDTQAILVRQFVTQ